MENEEVCGQSVFCDSYPMVWSCDECRDACYTSYRKLPKECKVRVGPRNNIDCHCDCTTTPSI